MYIIEAGRGALPNLGVPALAAYIVFAPSVSAGPIDQPRRFIEQLLNPGKLDLERVIYALYRIATGVIFKFVIADTIGEISDSFVPEAMAVSLKRLLVFGPYYSLWLYFDFAGYSHIAIGAGYLFGVKCMENFAAPLLRSNISEFWRTWHISLTTFLRNYIFLPGAYRWSRVLGPQRAAYAATVLAFAVCGVWHGDGLNFLLWGLYHGVLLSLHQAFLYNTRKVRFFARLRRQRWLAIPAWAFTFGLVSLGWFPFAFSVNELRSIFLR
jgi:membrane protein involved in D-alanine export